MRRLTFAMNLSLDGYVAAPGDDLGWSVPSDELFQWWSDRVGATGLALYGRKLWETMSSHWPTADQQPGAAPAQIEFARRWRDMPKVVFSSTTGAVDWNARLVTGDAVTEVTRLKTENGGPMDVGGATLAAAVMQAGLIDEYAIVTHPVLVRRHAVLHDHGQLGAPEPVGDPDVSRRRAPDQVRDQALNTRPRIGACSGHPRSRGLADSRRCIPSAHAGALNGSSSGLHLQSLLYRRWRGALISRRVEGATAMDGADVFGVVRAVLTSALDQAAAAARPATDELAAATSAVQHAQQPDAWADVLAWALAKVAALDPRLVVSVDGTTITLRFTEAGGTAAVSVAAYGGAASPAVLVSVQGNPALRLPAFEVSGSGHATWRIDAGGPADPTGSGSLVATLRVPVGRTVAAETGAKIGVGGHVVVVVRLADQAPLWKLLVTADGVSAEVEPAALLGVSGLPTAKVNFAPTLDVQQGGTPQLVWS